MDERIVSLTSWSAAEFGCAISAKIATMKNMGAQGRIAVIDLIERLRAMAGSDMVPMEKVMYLLTDAADALEAMLDEVETLRDGLDYLRQVQGVPDVLQLRAKAARAERLAGALKRARESIEEWAYFAQSCGGEITGLQEELSEIDLILHDHGKEGDHRIQNLRRTVATRSSRRAAIEPRESEG